MTKLRKALALITQAEGALKVAVHYAPPVSRDAISRAMKDAQRAKSAVACAQGTGERPSSHAA